MTSKTQSFQVPVGIQRFESEVKRSRFICSVIPVAGKQAAQDAIHATRREFPDANHHCWAMVAGNPEDVYQQDQSDDGEPRGTAGKPMLNVLQHAGFGNTVVVVTRYFGGIKLGTGGLVRAYSQAVSAALKRARTEQSFVRSEHRVELPYSLLDTLEHWLKDTHILIQDKQFSDKVTLLLLVPVAEVAPMIKQLETIGGGMISVSGASKSNC